MFIYPDIQMIVARDHHRELIAEADKYRLLASALRARRENAKRNTGPAVPAPQVQPANRSAVHARAATADPTAARANAGRAGRTATADRALSALPGGRDGAEAGRTAGTLAPCGPSAAA